MSDAGRAMRIARTALRYRLDELLLDLLATGDRPPWLRLWPTSCSTAGWLATPSGSRSGRTFS